jgi:5-oxoprolinase (ATP-hydrolysing)
MTTVFLHPLAGVLSAYGMGLADVRVLREKAVEAPLEAGLLRALASALDALAGDAAAELTRQGVADNARTAHRRLHLRYAGTDTALIVPMSDLAEIKAEFESAHRQRYGFIVPGKRLIVEAVSVELVGVTEKLAERALPVRASGKLQAKADLRIFSGNEWHDAPIYERADLASGDRLPGPAIISEQTGTIVIEPGWQAELAPLGHLLLRRVQPLARKSAIGTSVDPVMLEVFNNLFMSIAEQMGSTLENTSHSVNIKERLDFSCALFDGQGNLIANAPHMPVHLGSMGDSVATIIRSRRNSMQPGDVYVLNAPYNGGTHLPDITVVTPVFDETSGEVLFYTASRGHHADVGGITPGSMPPDSRTVEDEGVLIDDFQLVEQGRFREAEIRALLATGRHPARNPDQNIADLAAQVAANAKGAEELRRMTREFGRGVVEAYMRHVQDNAEEQVRRVIDRLTDGRFVYEMDDGSRIAVSVGVDRQGRSARIDFTGTSPQLGSNFNAPSSVCRAAVLYVFRTLVEDDIPMNAGCLKPLDIIIPEGSMLSPRYPAAVVAGNVETSQCITDALYGALGVMAAAQGTMNNFTFGNAQHQYYETICGGSGAAPDFDGTDAVHTHMTNSRLTDPEVLEWRFPVLVESFAIRRGSGGRGKHRGGDGVIRRIRFREAMTAAILSGHRRVPPYGVAGGEPGTLGRNTIERSSGAVETLGGTDRAEMAAGDVFVIETPGGGGFGKAG